MEEGFGRDAHDDLEHNSKHTQLLRDAEPVQATEDVGVPVALADSARPRRRRGGDGGLGGVMREVGVGVLATASYTTT